MGEYNIGKAHYDMMRRCYNPNDIAYASYGAKGIRVYEEWHDREVFRKWAKENGYKKGLRLKRKDGTKDYTPDNCFWDVPITYGNGIVRRHKERSAKHKQLKKELGIEKISDSPVISTYREMISRCRNPHNNSYKNYGARGVTVCEEWACKDGVYAFLKWAKTSGWKPGLTIDRIDNEKGYSPDNCKWSTMQEQQNNKRNTPKYEYRGFSLTIAEIARLENINDNSIRYYMKTKNMSVEDAVKHIKSKRKG